MSTTTIDSRFNSTANIEITPRKDNKQKNIIKGPVELKMIGRQGAIEGKIKRYDRLFRMFSKASKCSKVAKKQVMRDLKKIIHNMSNTSKVKTHSFRNFDFLPKYDVDSRLFNETVCSKIRRSNKFDKSNEMWRKRVSASLISSTKPSIDDVKRSYVNKPMFQKPSDSFKIDRRLIDNQTFMSPQIAKRSIFSREVRNKSLFDNSHTLYDRNPSSLMTQNELDWFKQEPNEVRSSSIENSFSPS